MANITKTKLTEILKSKGVSEGFLSNFFKKIKLAKAEKEYQQLTNDPKYQQLLKKYKIKPVDYIKKYDLDDLPAFRKK
jgi:hypothetical protein|tara:strand:- start:361 stop:594 length:234 start_codon:yes stop_codon:yes gene_type:complete